MSVRTAVSAASTQRSFVGINAHNSIAFVDSVFTCLEQRTPIVILKDSSELATEPMLPVRNVIDPPVKTGWASLTFTPNRTDEIAQVAFTSGTEGRPKGILITHANLADMVDRLDSLMHLDDSVREYVGVPVYHSFGFGRCRAVATAGGAFYIPPNGFDPLEIKHLLDMGEINAISAVPSLWRVLFSCEDVFGSETENVRWIEIGSQYMSAEEKLRLKRLFPNAIIIQHYGLTEASRATFLEIHKAQPLDHLESVGVPVGDTEIKITEDGRIAVRGSLVASQYISKGIYKDLTDDDGWLVTSDLGEVVGNHLSYKGRADDIINCGGVKVSPDDLEKRLRARLGLNGGLTCCRIGDTMRGHGVLIAYLGEVDREKLKTAATEILAQMHVNLGNSLKLMPVDAFPTTATGKVKRKELAKKYLGLQARQESLPFETDTGAERPISAREQELIELWQKLLAVDTVGVDESFHDLGGDSLTAISAIVKMKKMGIPEQTCRGILQGKTIAEIAESEKPASAIAGAPDLSAPAAEGIKDTLNIRFVRGLLVLMVIAAHWSGGVFQRLPDSYQWLTAVLAPVFSFGTPGFAILYGVAMGYSVYPLYLKSPERVKGFIWPICSIILSGVLIIAVMKILLKYINVGGLTLTDFTNSFYNVLTFYLLATLSLTLWFWMLKKSRAPVVTALGAALFLHLFYLQFMIPLTRVPAEGFVELAKLLIAAKYSYFNMTCGVFVGLAVGIAMSAPASQRFRLSAPAALMLAIMSVLAAWWLADLTGESAEWSTWPVGVVSGWRWLFYIGASLLLLIGTDRLLNSYSKMPRPVSFSINVIACFGFLAFPMFVSHELVLPMKELLEVGGLSNTIAIAISLGAFLVLSGVLITKTYRLQSV